VPSLGPAPGMPMLPRNADFLAVKGRSGFCATRSIAPLSIMSTLGGAQQCPPPPWLCLCPGRAQPQRCHQPVTAGLRPRAAFCPVRGDSHRPVPLAAVILPCSPAPCARTAHTALGASSALPRAPGTPGSGASASTAPGLTGAVPSLSEKATTSRCPRDAAQGCRVTGTRLSGWHGAGSSRREGAAPAHLLQAKVTGVLLAPSVQPPISFIDLFSTESSN